MEPVELILRVDDLHGHDANLIEYFHELLPRGGIPQGTIGLVFKVAWCVRSVDLLDPLWKLKAVLDMGGIMDEEYKAKEVKMLEMV
ncbi:MAG: hypothetical protein Q6373_025345 [Candidatus Sigynarchaeota archaeon]